MGGLIDKAEATMVLHDMLPERAVLAGLSGGADSAALTHILCRLSHKYGFKVYAAHVNHGLRGAAADSDEEHSRDLAKSMGIGFFSLRADVRGEAAQLGISEELAGRKIRYEFFERLALEHDIDKIATAHHKNDNAETVLMNFIRGSGIKGLCGIPYKRGRIIRPLMDISRAELEGYCAENKIEYVTDATNLESVYTRNKTRNILIPMIEESFNPAFIETVTRNARLVANEEDYISFESARAYNDIVKDGGADIPKLTALHSAIAMRVIRLMTDAVCGNEDIPVSVTEAVLELARRNRTGSRTDVGRGAYAAVEYGRLIIKKEAERIPEFEYEIKIGKGLYIPESGFYILARPCNEYKRDGAEYFSMPEGARLGIRNRREGDKFCPWGMNGTKKLKNFMIDEKIPRDERARVGILTIDGEIAWVVGYRRDRRFKFNKKGIKISISY